MYIGAIIVVFLIIVFLAGFYTIMELQSKVEILKFRNDFLKKDVEYYKNQADHYFKVYMNEIKVRK